MFLTQNQTLGLGLCPIENLKKSYSTDTQTSLHRLWSKMKIICPKSYNIWNHPYCTHFIAVYIPTHIFKHIQNPIRYQTKNRVWLNATVWNLLFCRDWILSLARKRLFLGLIGLDLFYLTDSTDIKFNQTSIKDISMKKLIVASSSLFLLTSKILIFTLKSKN